MPLRVLLDTNLLISYLLAPQATERTVVEVIQHAWGGAYILLVPEDLVVALAEKLATKPYVRRHITPAQADDFIQALHVLAELSPPVPEPIPRVVRDPYDDYLLAAALVADADVLVSGDADLLVLAGHLDRPRILRPGEFLAILVTST